ncbi:hypothetical protein AX16_008749 [Volvariella volvacea WC 439]|nr:hypothetical protein AX16_008749 [Volvariella volvacea WC 439]
MLAQDSDNRIPPQIPVYLESSILNGRTLYAIVKDGRLMTVESSHKIDSKFIDARTTQLKNKLVREGVRRIQSLIHTVDWKHTKWLYLDGDLSSFEEADRREYELFPCNPLRRSLHRIKALPWASIIHEDELVVEKWISAAERVCRWRGQQVMALIGWSDITLQRVERAMEGYRMLAGRPDYPGLHEVLGHVVDDDGLIVGIVTELPASARSITYDDMPLVHSALGVLERDRILLRGVEGDNFCIVDGQLRINTPEYTKRYLKSERKDFLANKKGHHDFALDSMFKFLKRLKEHNSMKIPKHLRERALMMIPPIPDLSKVISNGFAVPNRQMLEIIAPGYRCTVGSKSTFPEQNLIRVRAYHQNPAIISYDAIRALFAPDCEPTTSNETEVETPLPIRTTLKHATRAAPYNTTLSRSYKRIRPQKFILFKDAEDKNDATAVSYRHGTKRPIVYNDEDVEQEPQEPMRKKIRASDDEPLLYRPDRTQASTLASLRTTKVSYADGLDLHKPPKAVLPPSPRPSQPKRTIIYHEEASHKLPKLVDPPFARGQLSCSGPIIARDRDSSDDEHYGDVPLRKGQLGLSDAPVVPRSLAVTSNRHKTTKLLLRDDS